MFQELVNRSRGRPRISCTRLVSELRSRALTSTSSPPIQRIYWLQPVFQHLELQSTHHADDNLFHAAAQLLENLNSALLRDLRSPFDELLALHGIGLADKGKMLRRKGGESPRRRRIYGRKHKPCPR